ncbi:MAG TPA: molybdopterin-dependent oxidoreductase [Alphaproteobacteria bacterium]|jgi:assimilatory nitrate reductase catalytic subunit
MTGTSRAVRTTCPYCGVGCGVIASVPRGDGSGHPVGPVAVSGDPDHPANFGRLCSKGSALGETLSLDDRLLHPLVAGRRAAWGEALDLVAERFAATVAEHGPDSVAFYVSGQLLTEDYYVANKLMKGFIGSANIDTNSRLCMASSVAGHKRAFGSDTVPGTYEDLEQADLLVLVGSNLAWCHPVLFQRVLAAKAARPEMKIVVVDPRRTQTAAAADMFLPLAPGADVALFDGLLAHLKAAGKRDARFVADHTSGVDAALAVAETASLADVAIETGLGEGELRAFYDLFAATEQVVTVYSQGVNQSSHGTDKVNAIINCHLFTGRIGQPGMGPFSVTGQPNAMGGREVGGLANQLAAHMELDNAEHRNIVQSFWHAPRMADHAGLKAVDLFRAVGEGRIKAIWIAGTNPVDSLPDADAVKAALAACPFVVVSDVVRRTDTTAFAHVLLPAAAWGEKDGTVTNSERRISRQRAFLPLPGEAKPDWWIFAQVARRMGWREAFDFASPADIFAEYAGLSGSGNDGKRDFDISGLTLDRAAYDEMTPVQWPLPVGGSGAVGEKRFFADGRFFTPDRRARFVATPIAPPASQVGKAYPLVLNTGRIRDQWHTMTRTAKTARLMGHLAEPFAEIHPDDARTYGIEAASIVELRSLCGGMLARALVTERQRRGSVFVPMHWTDQYASAGRVDALLLPNVDAVSGQPELKFTPVSIRPAAMGWHGFAVLASKPNAIPADYWALAPAARGWRLELASVKPPEDWGNYARALFGDAPGMDMLAYGDGTAGHHRFAAFKDGRLAGALFTAPEPVAAARNWLVERLGDEDISEVGRQAILAGRGGATAADPGATVCSCFGVGVNQIGAAAQGGCRTVAAIGASLRAGTNCGSCRSEIQALLNRFADSMPPQPMAAE